MAGLAAIQVAQHVAASWQNTSDTPESIGTSWRQAFSMIVRWRQLSEPCDPVVWVDALTSASSCPPPRVPFPSTRG